MADRRSAAHRRLARATGRAIADFAMIAEGDRILCALSGGKDSFTLYELLCELRRRAPVRFELEAVHLDQGHPDVPRDAVEQAMARHGYACRTFRDDTYSIVKSKVAPGETPCALCSRLRRAILYRLADELGCNKLALGHHRDDLVVTLLLNLLFAGQLKAMPPKLVSDDGAHVVIRPLCYCAEQDIVAYVAERGYAPVPCPTCGSRPSERRRASELLAELDRRYGGVRASMLSALGDVRASHLLDTRLWQALGLAVGRDIPARPVSGVAAPLGDEDAGGPSSTRRAGSDDG
jgi:tRNA 2-thiocytidine biosynthesis protein TtcA